MADDVSIDGPVSIQSDSKERVAYDLTKTIARNESSSERKNRDYWLTLYNQCRKATEGYGLESILSKD